MRRTPPKERTAMDDLNPQKNRQIRLLLVDDSPVALLLLRRAVTQDPQIVVVGTARDGAEGLRLVHELKPDVVSTDLHMPVMNGLELTRRIMAESPRPVLVCSTAVQSEHTTTVFDLLQAGALDVFPKPRTGLEDSNLAELIRKVKVLAGVTVFRNRRPISGTSSPAIHANLSDSQAKGRGDWRLNRRTRRLADPLSGPPSRLSPAHLVRPTYRRRICQRVDLVAGGSEQIDRRLCHRRGEISPGGRSPFPHRGAICMWGLLAWPP